MLPFSLALPFAAKALETLERPDSRHQGKYSTLPSGFAFVHPKQCDLQWVPPTSPPPPPAQVPMTRQKAPWARRAGAGWGPGGERRHTPSGGKPVPARWGVRGGGGSRARMAESHKDSSSRRKCVLQEEGAPSRCAVGSAKVRPSRKKVPPLRAPLFYFYFLALSASERAARRRKTVPGRRGNRGQQAPELLRLSPCRRAAAAVAPSSR